MIPARGSATAASRRVCLAAPSRALVAHTGEEQDLRVFHWLLRVNPCLAVHKGDDLAHAGLLGRAQWRYKYQRESIVNQ